MGLATNTNRSVEHQDPRFEVLCTSRAATIAHEQRAVRAVRVDARGSAASLAQWEELAAPEGPPAELQLGWKSSQIPWLSG